MRLRAPAGKQKCAIRSWLRSRLRAPTGGINEPVVYRSGCDCARPRAVKNTSFGWGCDCGCGCARPLAAKRASFGCGGGCERTWAVLKYAVGLQSRSRAPAGGKKYVVRSRLRLRLRAPAGNQKCVIRSRLRSRLRAPTGGINEPVVYRSGCDYARPRAVKNTSFGWGCDCGCDCARPQAAKRASSGCGSGCERTRAVLKYAVGLQSRLRAPACGKKYVVRLRLRLQLRAPAGNQKRVIRSRLRSRLRAPSGGQKCAIRSRMRSRLRAPAGGKNCVVR